MIIHSLLDLGAAGVRREFHHFSRFREGSSHCDGAGEFDTIERPQVAPFPLTFHVFTF